MSLREAKDTDADPCFTHELIYWNRAPKNGKPQGESCYYCWKVYINIYAAKYRSVKALQEAMARIPDGPALVEEFKGWRQYVIATIIAKGTRDIRIVYSEEAKQQVLSHHKQQIIDLIEPEDTVLLLEDYVKLHGHPHSNGKGHRIIKHPSMKEQDAVLIPGARQWKIQRRSREMTDLASTLHDGQDVLEEGQLEKMQAELEDELFGTRAVGFSFDSLIGSTSDASGSGGPVTCFASPGLRFIMASCPPPPTHAYSPQDWTPSRSATRY